MGLSWFALTWGYNEVQYVDSESFLGGVVWGREVSSDGFDLVFLLDIAKVADKSIH